MFAGKTSALVEAALKVKGEAFKPAIDSRYDKSDIVTHDGQRIKAEAIESLWPITNKDCPLFLDEAQFFDTIELAVLVAFRQTKKLDTYLSFLDYYSNGDRTPIARMFDKYVKNYPDKILRAGFWATCKFCGKAAGRTVRLADNKNNNFIGGAESYAPACSRCWVENRRD